MQHLTKIATCTFLIVISITANVYAFFSSLWSAPVSVRIGPVGPRSADLSLSCDPSRISVGNVLTVCGELVNATSREGIEGKDIRLYYRQSTDYSWNYLTSVQTDSNGAYSYLWSNTSMLTPGCYVVNATFAGSVDFDRWTSISDLQVIQSQEPVQHRLTVYSAHDSPNPPKGDHYYDHNELVTCSVTSPVTEGNTVWTCTGWSGTGSVPSSGSGPSVTFQIKEDSSIIWNWQGEPIENPDVALIRKYFPVYKFSAGEEWYPCSFYFDGDGQNWPLDLYNKDRYDSYTPFPPPYYAYAHIVENATHKTIQYWLYYVWNSHQVWGTHYTDWDSTVFVVLDKTESSPVPVEAYHFYHLSKERLSWNDWPNKEDSTHLVVYVALGSHGAYLSQSMRWWDEWYPDGEVLREEDFNWYLVGDCMGHGSEDKYCNMAVEWVEGEPQWEFDSYWWPKEFPTYKPFFSIDSPWHRGDWMHVTPSPNDQLVSITGQFHYFDSEGDQRFVDRALVELYDEDSGLDELLDSTYTTSEGFFVLGPVENVDDQLGESGTRDLYIKVHSENWVGRVCEDLLALPYECRTTTAWDVLDGEHHWGSMPVPEEQYPVFFILHTITLGYDYVHSFVDSFSAPINVIWYHGYEGYLSGGTGYHPPTDTIHLTGTEVLPDQWDDGIILHEYGHFVADKLDIDAWYNFGGEHQWSGVYSPELAWSEGWAHFFSCTARRSPAIRDTMFPPVWVEYNVETGIQSNDLGETEDANALGGCCEASVAGILWDIYDGYSMRDDQDGDGIGDSLDDKEAEIWDVVQFYSTGGLLPHKVYTIFDFWKGWFGRGHGNHQEMCNIYHEHGEITLPALSLTAHSPINVMIKDSNDRRVGYDPQAGTVVNEITGATYSGPGTEPQEIFIPNPLPGTYEVYAFGTGTGSYTITLESIVNGSIVDTDTWQGMAEPDGQYCEIISLESDGHMTLPHDIEVTDPLSFKTVVGQGYSTFINVTITNQGNHTETFNMTLYANGTTMNTTTVTLLKGSFKTVTFYWNTAGFAKGNYTITAYATPVPDETDTADNTLTDGWIIVSIAGDITGDDGWPDGKVDMIDVRAVVKQFGETYTDPEYNPNYDVVYDLKIDMIDIRAVVKHFGETDP